LVQRYFGDVPRGPEARPVQEGGSALEREVVVRKTDDVPHQKVWLAWHSPAIFAPGDAELDITAALLSDGKESRLHRALVRETQVARDVSAYQASSLLGSLFIVEATAAEGHTSDEVVAEADRVLRELAAGGPTAEEVEVAVANWEAGFYRALQTIAEKANRLNLYSTFAGDPGYLGRDLAEYRDATAASVHEALGTWLATDRRVVLHVAPEE
jgi:zinc protease